MSERESFNRNRFKKNSKSAKALEKTRISEGNRIYGFIVEELIGDTPYFAEITRLRRDKTADRTETAKLIKKAIKQGLEAKGLSEEYLTAHFETEKETDPIYPQLVKLEKQAEKILAQDLKYLPVYTGFLSHVRGMGENTSAQLLATLGDLTRFEDPSSLWHYCGMGDPKKDRKIKNVECHYNPKMKSLILGVMGDNFLKQNSQYRIVYDQRTAKTKQTHPEWWHLNPDGTKSTVPNEHPRHGYRDGIRVMMKRFLCELWRAGYLAKGLEPPCNPYILNNPNHHLEPDIVPFDSHLSGETHIGYASQAGDETHGKGAKKKRVKK